MQGSNFFHLTKRRSPDLLLVPKVLITHYQSRIGAVGVALWLNLWAQGEGEVNLAELAGELKVSEAELEEALEALQVSGLIEDEGGTLTILEPESEPETLGEVPHELGDGLEVLFDFYQQQVGLMGPVQEDKLRYWVVDQGLDVEVVVAAIGEMMKTSFRRIEYLEGILRNWYNDGIRNLDDLNKQQQKWQEKQEKRKQKEKQKKPAFFKSLPGQPQSLSIKGYEGVANAGAYKKVDPDAVKRWKEMFEDEYNS